MRLTEAQKILEGGDGAAVLAKGEVMALWQKASSVSPGSLRQLVATLAWKVLKKMYI